MWLVSGIAAVLLVALDHITKYLALVRLKPIGNIEVTKGFLDFTFVENRGAAFGILSGQRAFFIILTAVVGAVIIYFFGKLPKTREYNWVRAALVLVFSGAIGNVIDRAFRGYVVDFMEFTFVRWPVFNLADIYVVLGTAVLVILLLFVIKEEPQIKTTDKKE